MPTSKAFVILRLATNVDVLLMMKSAKNLKAQDWLRFCKLKFGRGSVVLPSFSPSFLI